MWFIICSKIIQIFDCDIVAMNVLFFNLIASIYSFLQAFHLQADAPVGWKWTSSKMGPEPICCGFSCGLLSDAWRFIAGIQSDLTMAIEPAWAYFSRTQEVSISPKTIWTNISQRTFLDLALQIGTWAPIHIYIYKYSTCRLYIYRQAYIYMHIYICVYIYTYTYVCIHV